MNLGTKLLKWAMPKEEANRMEFRMELCRAAAHIEDLHRDLNGYMAAGIESKIILEALKDKDK